MTEGSRCAVHPEAPSAGTCSRCGAFRCVTCTVGAMCRACIRAELRALPGSAALAKAAMASIAVVSVARGVELLLERRLPEGIETLDPDAQTRAFSSLVAMGSVVLAAWLASGAVFLVWQVRLMKRAAALQAGVLDSPGIGVANWFIPLVQLMQPLFVFQRLAEKLLPGEKPKFVTWWMAWLGAGACVWLSRMMGTFGKLDVVATLDVVGLGLLFTAAAFCVEMIRTMERGLRETETRVLG